MRLGFDTTFEHLYSREGLIALDAKFVDRLRQSDVALHNRLVETRARVRGGVLYDDRGGEVSRSETGGGAPPTTKEESQLIIDLAPHVEDFIAELFIIRTALTKLKQKHFELAPLYTCKRLFVQRKAAKTIKAEDAEKLDSVQLEKELIAWIRGGVLYDDPAGEVSWSETGDGAPPIINSFELTFARNVMAWLDAPEKHENEISAATRYAAWAVHTAEGQEKHKNGILFKVPRKLDPLHLVAYETEIKDGVTVLKPHEHHRRQRTGFALTDEGITLARALDETNYCIWCHNQGKDSCSKGMKENIMGGTLPPVSLRETSPAGSSQSAPPRVHAPVNYKKNSLEITLAGCPLEEKISEMNFLKSEGIPIGALATVVIDNPMCAGTGHRICNDCMKGCIYQKQEPVNIPQAETRSLMDVLELPYGFEIYSLLTRWNPLNFARPIPKAESDCKVLVAGLGPAGYTLAHHLINDGHTVVGIDGLKIEPLPEDISGVTQLGSRVPFKPIRDIKELFEKLDERVLSGFGGVAEYGITVRWDKNFLKVIRLLIERRENFAMIGGVRFGGTITIESAWQLGFDHIALCMGAGSPTLIDMPNGLARGVRTASDFLMALQLSGAAKKNSIANLQLRLPVVVIGGGLTAIDTATESLAYYPVQVEKFLARYEILVREKGEAAVRADWSAEDAEIAKEFIAHAMVIREERKKSNPDIGKLLDEWGGVKVVYRKRLIDAPSYRLNHEEVEKALEENIGIVENFEPVGVEVDKYGHACGVKFSCRLQVASCKEEVSGEHATCNMQHTTIFLPAKSVLIAAGTSPNTVLQREDPKHVLLHGKYFQAVDEEGSYVSPEHVAKPAVANVLMALEKDGRAISFFGDLHPSFAGNVVKAMGSARQGYPVVSRVMAKRSSGSRVASSEFLKGINTQLRATVHDVIRLTHNIIEVIVHAPLAAKQFEPGQFYRLQNFEVNALKLAARDPLPGTTLAMEGLALTGAWVDKEKGLLSTIVLEMGGSSDLCAYLKKGEPVILMGPTGTATEIPEGKNVMLVGGGLGNAVLFSIGRTARERGNKVLYFAGYKKADDRYKIEEIERASDTVVWCCDEENDFTSGRGGDKVFRGNIVQAMVAYAEGKLGEVAIKTSDIDHIIAIGSDRMMAAVASARHASLKPYLKENHVAVGSINSPMQCMMKEICAQCIQQHIDPKTGAVTYVYSCFNQDQLLDNVSFPFLNERLKQNALQEKITAKWIGICLENITQ